MAIDLPPVLPPQLASPQQIEVAGQYQGSYVQKDFNGVLLRVAQAPYLSAEQVQGVLDGADSPSGAITALGRHYYNMGHLLVSLQYFRVANTVTVMVSQNRLKGLRGSPWIKHYFSGLVGDPDLSLAEFDRARVPAAIYAERAGLDYRVSYEVHDDGEVILDFIEQPLPEVDNSDIEFELNNRGSRFLGRYFARAAFTQRFASGTELAGGAQTTIPEWGEVGDGDSYRQFDLSVDQPLRKGLYGAELSYIRYERSPLVSQTRNVSGFCLPLLSDCSATSDTVVIPLDAEIQQASLRGEQLLYSNPLRRFTVFERLSYVDSRIEPRAGGEALLDERFGSIELGLRYTLREQWLSRPAFVSMAVSAEAGLGQDGGSFASEPEAVAAIGRRSGDYRLVKPALAARLALDENTVARLSLQGQWADDTQLPQQRQWVLGGDESLSAWLPGTLVGDAGWRAELALQRDYRWRGIRARPAVFVEYGASRFNDTGDELGEWQRLADAGLGVTIGTSFGLSSQWRIATPLVESVADDARLDRGRAYFFWRLSGAW